MSNLIRLVESYLNFVLSPARQSEDKDKKTSDLIRILDNLAIQAHQPGIFSQDDIQVEEKLTYQETYTLIDAHFPDFGYYPVALDILDPTGSSTGLADAIDDLTDIAIDLHEVLAIAKFTNEAEAQYAFADSYRIHWGTHLRDLQRYLHSRLTGH